MSTYAKLRSIKETATFPSSATDIPNTAEERYIKVETLDFLAR